MKKYISTFEIGESEYKLKDSEVRTDLGTHESNTTVHVTAEEKAYWNSKVNPPSFSAPTAKSLTYTGEAQDLLNAGSATAGTIQYSSDETNWSTTIPQGTNAGTYTAYWRFVGSESVYIDSTAIEVTIAKANPTYTAPTAKILTYNANTQQLLNAGSTSDGTISYSEDEENWSDSVPSATNVGDYTVYWKLTGDSNHIDVASTFIIVSIAKVTPTVTAPSAKILTYNGEAQTLLNAGSTDYGTLKYSDDGATYDTTIPSATNVNTYTIYYRVDGDSNINNVAAASIDCTISKVTPTVTAPTPKTLTYNTQAQVLANAGSTDFGTLQYSLSQNGTYTTDVPSETTANVTYYVWYRVVGDSNINNVSPANIECMIAEKRVTTPTITLDYDSCVYSGSANQPTPTVEDGGVIVNPTEYTVEYLNNVNAGEGTVIIVDKTAGNYYIEGTTVFTITKAAPSYTAPINANPTYTGSTQNILTSGSTQDGTVQYSSDNSTWGTTIPQQTNAGTYTAYWKLVGDSNHTNVASTSVTCTIAKADPSYTAPTAKSLTYSGSAQALLNVGSTSDGTIQYSSDGSTWSTTIPQGTNAGSYVVYWRLVGDVNHADVTATTINVSVAKLTPTVTAPTAKSGLTYTGSAQVLVNEGSTNYGTLQYSLDNSTWSTTIPSGTNAGNYDVYYKVAGDSNINDVASTYISVSIAKANRSASFEDANGHDYVEVAGIKWATKNVGASSVTDYGNYYMYGKGSTQYNSSDSAYTGNEDPLDLSVDTARQVMGGSWRQPTEDEFNTLIANTTYTWETVSGVIGMKFTATNNNYVFFPAAGCMWGGSQSDVGTYGYYWTSTSNASNPSAMRCGNGTVSVNDGYARKGGDSVRGILESSTKSQLSIGDTNTIQVFTSGSPTITLSSSDTSVATISGMTVTAVGAGTATITATVAGDSNYNSTSISYTLTVQWGDGIYAVKSNGDLELPANINTSTPNAYVGVGIINSSTNMRFFIDKRFPTGSAAAANVCNYKDWSSALAGKNQSYLTNIQTPYGDGNSIATAAPEATRTAALNAYNNGETGAANTTNICNDPNCSTDTAQNNAAKYCRSIANPVTGNYDGYLASLAEWIVVNDNQVLVNQILRAIGGVQFKTNASGTGQDATYFWTSSEYNATFAWSWLWSNFISKAAFTYYRHKDPSKNSSSTFVIHCVRPFFPL